MYWIDSSNLIDQDFYVLYGKHLWTNQCIETNYFFSGFKNSSNYNYYVHSYNNKMQYSKIQWCPLTSYLQVKQEHSTFASNRYTNY